MRHVTHDLGNIRSFCGGSALLPLPIDILSLEEKIQIIKLLQSQGATIQELNTVRQSMSQLKNGGLARISKAKTVSKRCCDLAIFSIKQIDNIIVGSNRIALEAAARLCLQSSAYVPFIMTTCLQGEAREVGCRIVELIKANSSHLFYNDNIASLFTDKQTFDAFQIFRKEHKRYCLLLGGETTVVMKNEIGKGGRCQELALAAALSIDSSNEDDTSLLILAAGSDGIDGPTDAAGAFAFNGMITNQDDIQQAYASLDKHDVYTYLNEINNGENLLKIGHTSTNVMDIIIVLVENKEK
ncbi:unnamed protein product [Rotaria socialis]|uniref:Glycerate kinase n=1 Tax=Rotaria socialis TaxID=392032 RepID=A0A821TQM1_9BILA|nr:unnamed protein product [Rotaria socialis]